MNDQYRYPPLPILSPAESLIAARIGYCYSERGCLAAGKVLNEAGYGDGVLRYGESAKRWLCTILVDYRLEAQLETRLGSSADISDEQIATIMSEVGSDEERSKTTQALAATAFRGGCPLGEICDKDRIP